MKNSIGVILVGLFFLIAGQARGQCGLVASMTVLSCNDIGIVSSPVDYWMLEISAGTPPFLIYNGSSAYYSYSDTGSYYVDAPAFGSPPSWSIEDGNGCVTSNFPQDPPITLSPGNVAAPYYVSMCPFTVGCGIEVIDAGITYDSLTGFADVRIGVIPHRWEFLENSTYTLTGPVNLSGTYASLPSDPLTAMCPCAPRLLPDLPPGTYTLEILNNALQFASVYGGLVEDCSFGTPVVQNFVVPGAPYNLNDVGVNVVPQVAMQGAMPSSGIVMSDSLRVLGLIPSTEPYSALGYVYSDPSLNGVTLSPSVLSVTGSDAIVDWVVVEVRSDQSPHGVLASKPALLQRDGHVVSFEGDQYVNFPSLQTDFYRVAVRHRNHLGIMDGQSEYLTLMPRNVDLRQGSLYGPGATTFVNGLRSMWSGNVNFDNKISYTGSANDRDPILVEIGGSNPTGTTSGYSGTDLNMDGVTKYTGSNNDRDIILVNIGGNVPTATRVEQLP